MKSGLEEFLKRIEAKPTNETLIDRFMTLVLEEDGLERILYLKSLVGLLLKTNPYAALKAAYVELQEARKEKLSNEYEIGALKDVESCFINLGKTDNAALVREEISKLQSDASAMHPITRSAAPKPSQKPINASLEFPLLPADDDDPASPNHTAERTRMAESTTPKGNTMLGEMARTIESVAKKSFENKPLPIFPDPEPKTDSTPRPSFASVQTPTGATPAAQELEDELFSSDRLMAKGDSSKEFDFSSTMRDRTRANPDSKPSNASASLESSFHVAEASAQPVEEEEGDDFGINFEYTKRTPLPSMADDIGSLGSLEGSDTHARSESTPTGRPTQAEFSTKDDIGESEYIPISSGIDETYENQPFFQPDDDDDELPSDERTMLISLEKLNESKEQISLASTSSATVKDVNYPVNSGPNFVVLDSDDDLTAIDLPATTPLPDRTALDPIATPFDPGHARGDAGHHPESASSQTGASFHPEPDFLNRTAASIPVVPAVPAMDPLVKVEVQPAPTAHSLASVAAGNARTASAPPPPFERKLDGDEAKSSGSPKPPDTFAITPRMILEPGRAMPLEDDDDDNYRYKEGAKAKLGFEAEGKPKPLVLLRTPSILQTWTLVQERFKLFSGLQIGRSHAIDFVERLLGVKTESPVVIKTLNLLLRFVDAELDKALCTSIAAWLFEDLQPRAMHQLWESLNLREEGLELYLLYLDDLIKGHQHRRALSIMHDILRCDLDANWYVESYPYLVKTWDRLGLEGWIWLEEEGGGVFRDRLARREEPLLATLLI